MDQTTAAPTRIAVLVCTYRRPEMLARLLDRIAGIQAASPHLGITAVVVDDDPQSSAKPAVDEYVARRGAVPVDYVALGSQDISMARNAALEHGLAHGEWMAFIDDDCLPEMDWLEQMRSAQSASGADIVTSGVRYFLRPGSPTWLEDQGFLDLLYDDVGGAPEWGCIANAMLRQDWFTRHPDVRFDTTFGKTGGEDMVFLRAATAAGAVMEWAPEAHVAEELPPERANFRYLLRRRFWWGNNNVMIHFRSRMISRPRMALRVARKWVTWVGEILGDVVRRRPFHARRRMVKAAAIWGMTLGLFGLEVGHR